MISMSEPFVYPGIQVEPSMYQLHGKQSKGRFRLGNQYTTKEWKTILSTIAWGALPTIEKTNIQSFLQAELGFRISSFQYTLKSLQAIQKKGVSPCEWFVFIETDELDDLVVLKIVMKPTDTTQTIFSFSQVEFLGYQLPQRVALGSPAQIKEASVPDHTYATNYLYRNQMPGAFYLDRETVHTLTEKDYSLFSRELNENWPTTLRPDPNSEGSQET